MIMAKSALALGLYSFQVNYWSDRYIINVAAAVGMLSNFLKHFSYLEFRTFRFLELELLELDGIWDLRNMGTSERV